MGWEYWFEQFGTLIVLAAIGIQIAVFSFFGKHKELVRRDAEQRAAEISKIYPGIQVSRSPGNTYIAYEDAGRIGVDFLAWWQDASWWQDRHPSARILTQGFYSAPRCMDIPGALPRG